MVRGFSGGYARRFLSRAELVLEESQASVNSARFHAPDVEAAPRLELPVTETEAQFSPGSAAGGGELLVDYDACWRLAGALAEYGHTVNGCLLEVVGQCEQIVEVSLRAPHLSGQVRLVSFRLKELIPKIAATTEDAERFHRDFSNEILAIVDSSEDGLELTAGLAGMVRGDTEQCLRSQVVNMRDHARRIRARLPGLEAELVDFTRTAASAMRPAPSQPQWPSGSGGSRAMEPDWGARNHAEGQARRVMGQIADLQDAAGNLEAAADVLAGEIGALNRLFEEDTRAITSCDSRHAARLRGLVREMRSHRRVAEQIQDSFHPTDGLTDPTQFQRFMDYLPPHELDAVMTRVPSIVIARAVTFDEHGNPIKYDWDILRTLDWDTLIAVITITEGPEGLAEIRASMRRAQRMFTIWEEEGFTSGLAPRPFDTLLLLQELNFRDLDRQIARLDSDPRFAQSRWEAAAMLQDQDATLAERGRMLQEYKDEIARIHGLPPGHLPPIVFDTNPDRNTGANGTFTPGSNQIWINPVGITHANPMWTGREPGLAEAWLGVVRHEVRHAYQHAVIAAPCGTHMVAPQLRTAWETNTQNFRQPPQGEYDLTTQRRLEWEYRNQPLEMDARRLNQRWNSQGQPLVNQYPWQEYRPNSRGGQE